MKKPDPITLQDEIAALATLIKSPRHNELSEEQEAFLAACRQHTPPIPWAIIEKAWHDKGWHGKRGYLQNQYQRILSRNN